MVFVGHRFHCRSDYLCFVARRLGRAHTLLSYRQRNWSSPPRTSRQVWRYFGVGWSGCILGLRDYEHRRALNALQARVYEGADPVRASAYPYWWNPFRWFGVVETQNFY